MGFLIGGLLTAYLKRRTCIFLLWVRRCFMSVYIKRAAKKPPFRETLNRFPYTMNVHRTFIATFPILCRQQDFALCGARLRALP